MNETVYDEEYYSEMFSARPYYFSRYFVDGFRSLQSFSIRLEEGLNAFVGPNGSGKTTFIDFLDFLSVLINRGASQAVSSGGGISRVFSQETLKSRLPRIRAEVSGLADLRPFVSKEDRSLFRFEYAVDIRFSKYHAAIYIASESIKFKSLFWDDLAVKVDSTVGTLALRRTSPSDDGEVKWEVGTRLLSSGSKNPLRYRSRRSRSVADEGDELLQTPRLDVDESILARSGLPALDAVRSTLSRGRSFNLHPAIARMPDDISVPPTIKVDGSGLSATLYHMQQARKRMAPRTSVFARRMNEDMLDNVINWSSLVLPELRDITVDADPHTGKYIAYLVVDSHDRSLRIPLQSASDGTVKWLSFVCLILTMGSAYSIEEPENFLHPKMQRFLISLIRESMEEDHPGHFILSTHSETIINSCKPSELLLFEFKGGHTSCKRLENPESVSEQINRTGFGLGYYYAANAVS